MRSILTCVGRLVLATAAAVALAGAGLLSLVGQAQSAPVDRLELVHLGTGAPGPDAPPGAVHFQAQLNYELATVPRAFLLLFIFEDAAQASTQDTSGALWVPPGSGQVTLDIDYVPRGEVEAITLLAALFREDESMLTWVGTTPISLRPWPARSEFEAAMAARLAGDLEEVVRRLDRAIELSPETGQFYYWRADTLARLNHHRVAIEDFTRALEYLPADRASLTGRGVSWLWLNEWQAAIADLSQVIDQQAEPDRWLAWSHRARGIAYAGLGQSALAIGDYQAYLRLAPDAPDRAQVERWIEALT